jgi:uracil-DNA glycosylase family 4
MRHERKDRVKELLPTYGRLKQRDQMSLFGSVDAGVQDKMKFQASQDETKAQYIQRLATMACACTRCSLGKAARKSGLPSVLSKGNPDAKVLILAEAPGRDELAARIPLVGPSGRVWHDLLSAANIDDHKLYHTNALLCKVDKTDTKRLDDQLKACAPYFEHQLYLIKPRFIIALGKTAMTRLGSRGGHSPLDLEIELMKYQKIPWTWVAHPAYTLRNMEYFDSCRDKLKAIVSLLKAEYGIDIEKAPAVVEEFV